MRSIMASPHKRKGGSTALMYAKTRRARKANRKSSTDIRIPLSGPHLATEPAAEHPPSARGPDRGGGPHMDLLDAVNVLACEMLDEATEASRVTDRRAVIAARRRSYPSSTVHGNDGIQTNWSTELATVDNGMPMPDTKLHSALVAHETGQATFKFTKETIYDGRFYTETFKRAAFDTLKRNNGNARATINILLEDADQWEQKHQTRLMKQIHVWQKQMKSSISPATTTFTKDTMRSGTYGRYRQSFKDAALKCLTHTGGDATAALELLLSDIDDWSDAKKLKLIVHIGRWKKSASNPDNQRIKSESPVASPMRFTRHSIRNGTGQYCKAFRNAVIESMMMLDGKTEKVMESLLDDYSEWKGKEKTKLGTLMTQWAGDHHDNGGGHESLHGMTLLAIGVLLQELYAERAAI